MAVDDGPSRLADLAARLGVVTTYAIQGRRWLIATELDVPASRSLLRFALPYLRDYLLDHPSHR